MDSTINDILRRMGWTTGLHLPIADNENKALQNEIEVLMFQKAKATQLSESEENRYSSITKHLKYVKVQNDENQKLLGTYRQHLETQEHKFLVTQSEKERVLQETRQAQKKMREIEDRVTVKRKDLDRGMTKMEKMQIETNWDNEALKAWEESLKKRDQDNELLKKFSKEDEKKAKDLEMKRQNLQMEATNKSHTLTQAIADVAGHEQVLERTERIIKQQKEEHGALIKQWQAVVGALRRRDDGIDASINEISMTQELLNEQQERLNEQNNFLNIEKNNNKEMEHQIEEANMEGSKLRRQLNELVQYVLTLNNELNTLKKTIIGSANFLEKERGKGRSLMKDINDKGFKTKQTKTELNNLEKKLTDIESNSISVAERAKELEQIIENEQRQTKILEADIERMQGVLYRTQLQMNELKDTAKLKEMEIRSCETSINLAQKHIRKLNDELQKQKEINYDLDFSKNELQMKLDKLEGHALDLDDEVKVAKIEELKQILSDENEVSLMLQNQITQIEEEMRRLSSAIQSDNIQLETLQDKLQYEVLSFEGGMKQVNVAKQDSQQKQVDENILRLRVNQMENIMKRENYSICNLQKFRLELEMAMRERQIEINTNRDILVAKRRNVDEEKGRLKRDITARRIKIDQLQKRFHIAMSMLGKDESGQPLSVTHFKIKNAQEKYMLQEEGDQLDGKIRTAEKEIVAMENTLSVVNNANNTYKKSLSAIEEYDKEVEEMDVLEKDISNISAMIRNKKYQLTTKRNEVRELKLSLIEADEERTQARQDLGNVENEYADLQRYILEQIEKINRTQRYLCSSMKHITGNIEKYKKNLLIRQLDDGNKTALQQLAEISIRHQDMTPHVTRYLSDHELDIPSPPPRLTPSSSSNSTRSSVYYASGPCVASVVLQFNPNAEGGNKKQTSAASYKQTKQKPKSKIKKL